MAKSDLAIRFRIPQLTDGCLWYNHLWFWGKYVPFCSQDPTRNYETIDLEFLLILYLTNLGFDEKIVITNEQTRLVKLVQIAIDWSKTSWKFGFVVSEFCLLDPVSEMQIHSVSKIKIFWESHEVRNNRPTFWTYFLYQFHCWNPPHHILHWNLNIFKHFSLCRRSSLVSTKKEIFGLKIGTVLWEPVQV